MRIKTARDNYEQHRKLLHNDFIRDKASCVKTDPKSFWRFINSKRSSNALPSKIVFNGEEAKTDKEKADVFAKFLQSVYVQHDDDPDLCDFIDNRDDRICFNIQFCSESIHHILSRMDLSKGSGHDGVSSLFLRQCADFLAKPLSEIFNHSITNGCYPDSFKIGQIT